MIWLKFRRRDIKQQSINILKFITNEIYHFGSVVEIWTNIISCNNHRISFKQTLFALE